MSRRRRGSHEGSSCSNECAFVTDVWAFLSTEWTFGRTDRPALVGESAFFLHGCRFDIAGRAFDVARSRGDFEERAFDRDDGDVCFESRTFRR
jgi:hypothetical protein